MTDTIDLTFRPVRNLRPRTLHVRQIGEFNHEGFLRPFRLLSRGQTAALQAWCDRIVRDMGRFGAFGIDGYQARVAGLWNLCRMPKMLDIVEDLIGPNILCWNATIFCKQPGEDRRVPWHQDAFFWPMLPCRTVTVWLAVDEATQANGALHYMPRTHDKGALSHVKLAENDPSYDILHYEALHPMRHGIPVVNALEAGCASVHADTVLHFSPPNLSKARRCAIAFRFMPPHVKVLDEVWGEGIEPVLCRGNDPFGFWRAHPRPRTDDITQVDGPRDFQFRRTAFWPRNGGPEIIVPGKSPS